MRVLVAPDSYKESMSAKLAAESIRRGLLSVNPKLQLDVLPLADGGEGTVQSLVEATGGIIKMASVHDPLHRMIRAAYGILGDGRTAIIEMAAASGIELLKDHEKNPMKTSSYGTGELVLHALERDCDTIILGIGGSATNEGGAGMIQALGGTMLDSQGIEIIPTGAGLEKLASINLNSLDQRIHKTTFIAACDVDNVLLGDSGATMVYGPQKGATFSMLQQLEKNLKRYAIFLEQASGMHILNKPGSGAAGGMGAGMMAALGAELRPGFEVVANITQLEKHIGSADLVITGEGKIDRQSQYGKTPFGVAKLAQKLNVPVMVLAGQVEDIEDPIIKDHFRMIRSITPGGMNLETALKNGPVLLEEAAARIWKEIESHPDTL